MTREEKRAGISLITDRSGVTFGSETTAWVIARCDPFEGFSPRGDRADDA
jgi:hypothetical protein